VKVKKCQFGGNTVHYLGHVVGGGQIHPNEEKVQAVCEYPRVEASDEEKCPSVFGPSEVLPAIYSKLFKGNTQSLRRNGQL